MKPSSSTSSEDIGLFDGVLARGPVAGLVDDAATLQAMLDVEAALAAAEAEVGLLPPRVAEQIREACQAERFDIAQIARDSAAAGNPVVPLVRILTARVRETAGDEAAGWVHFGATSQDILDTGLILVTRAALDAITAELRLAADIAAELTRAHAGTVMAGRTLMQQALPITFGLKTAGWLVALDEAADVLARASDELPAQLGGAAGTLASLDKHGTAVLSAYASSLRLAEPVAPWHTTRVPIAAAASAAGIAAGVVGKIALDVVLLAQTEVAEVVEEAPGRGGSSTMPHKRNPVAAVSALAGARRAPGLVAVLLAAMPQEHERAAGSWHAEWSPLRELLVATGSAASWLTESLRSLRVDPERMRVNLELTGGLLLAERVTTALQPALGRLSAHHLVETACRRAVEENRNLREVLLDTPEIVDTLGADGVDVLMDPAGYLGSTPQFIERALHRHTKGTV
jgi:3-carboxy-cis,cis-muconate cycloisomerase